jgi:hypothetical protein
MWDYKYRTQKKTVEARAKYAGADVLLTTSNRSVRLAMNGGIMFKGASDLEDFANELHDAAKTSKEILEAQ